MDPSVVPAVVQAGAPAPAAPVPAEPARLCLLFEVAGRRFGLWASVVRETVRAVTVAALPNSPPAVPGVINLRGQVVPVFSLRARFRLPAKPVEVSDHLIVVAAGGRVVALHVDRALGLVELAPRDVAQAVAVTAASEYLEGIAVFPDGLILIHDPASFLSLAESATLDAALAVPA